MPRTFIPVPYEAPRLIGAFLMGWADEQWERGVTALAGQEPTEGDRDAVRDAYQRGRSACAKYLQRERAS